MVNESNWNLISQYCNAHATTLVAVSKTKPLADIQTLYDLGQRDFGENYVQELAGKQVQLPSDIRWHYIGHLQTNKVKVIAPFVHLIHAVDSLKLLEEINKQALKNNCVIDVLLQMHIAAEKTKFGFDEEELLALFSNQGLEALKHTRIRGLMGMATLTDDETQIRKEFQQLKKCFEKTKTPCVLNLTSHISYLSMGMSADYKIAIEEGSNMVRIGSLLFGAR